MKTCFCFKNEHLWIRRTPKRIEHLFKTDAAPGITPLAELPDQRWVAEANTPPTADAELIGLRALFDLVSPEVSQQAGLARQILYWHQTHRFCGKCGTPMVRHLTEHAMACPSCHYICYPRINPVVITLIHKGNQILLAHKTGNQLPFWSLVAGFVEAAETLEQAVAREVNEEVGIRIKDIRYATSQPWSYPNNLMIGFTAAYDSGEIRPDGEEIAEAGWFDSNNLPPIPSRISVARTLIDAFFNR